MNVCVCVCVCVSYLLPSLIPSLSPSLFQLAMEALADIRKLHRGVGDVGEGAEGRGSQETSSMWMEQGDMIKREMCVEQGDVIEADLSDATVVWCANLCMSLGVLLMCC